MSKRKAFWLLLASGAVLPFNCIPTLGANIQSLLDLFQ